jgi:hypothetical protein
MTGTIGRAEHQQFESRCRHRRKQEQQEQEEPTNGEMIIGRVEQPPRRPVRSGQADGVSPNGGEPTIWARATMETEPTLGIRTELLFRWLGCSRALLANLRPPV